MTSSTVPSKFSNGPSLILTRSPRSTLILTCGRLLVLGRLLAEHLLDLVVGHLRRGAVGPHEVADAGGLADGEPGLLVQLHLDHDVAGVRLPLDGPLLVVADLDDLLGRHDDPAEEPLEALDLDPALEGVADRVLAAALDLQDVPDELRRRLVVVVHRGRRRGGGGRRARGAAPPSEPPSGVCSSTETGAEPGRVGGSRRWGGSCRASHGTEGSTESRRVGSAPGTGRREGASGVGAEVAGVAELEDADQSSGGTARGSRRRRGRAPSGPPSPGRPSWPASARRGSSTRPCSSRLRSRSGTRRTAGTRRPGRASQPRITPTIDRHAELGRLGWSPRCVVELDQAEDEDGPQGDRRPEPGPACPGAACTGRPAPGWRRTRRPRRGLPDPPPPLAALAGAAIDDPSFTLPMTPSSGPARPGTRPTGRTRDPRGPPAAPSSPRLADSVCTDPIDRARAEGIEPPTAGFGDRCSTN